MKLALILIAFLTLSFNTLDNLHLFYSFTGNVYLDSTLIRNDSVIYYEFPTEYDKKIMTVDASGKYSCKILANGPCPPMRYGTGVNIQSDNLDKWIKRANSDSIVFYYNGSIYRLRNMADSLIYNYLRKRDEIKSHQYVPFENEFNPTFKRDLYFTSK